MPVPWWDAPVAAARTAPGSTNENETGCAVPARRRAHRITATGEGDVGSLLTLADLRVSLQACDGKPCVVAITAHWCEPCVRFEPKFKALAREYGGEVAFATIDVDLLDDDACDALGGVDTVPTFLLYKNGVEVARVVGVAHKRPARAIANAIKNVLLD